MSNKLKEVIKAAVIIGIAAFLIYAYRTSPADAKVEQILEWETNFEDAKALSVKFKKPMLVNFTGSDWCGYCIELDQAVFNTREFKLWAAQNVILVKIDFPKQKSLPVKEQI